jgi:hypothetical protein
MRLLKVMERVMGIEPTLVAWEATVLPLNYTRNSQSPIVYSRQGEQSSQTGTYPGTAARANRR